VQVKVGAGKIILVLSDFSADRYIRFLNDRYVFGPKGVIEDHSMQSRLRFVDDLLVGIEAEDARGNEDTVTYVHPVTGKEEQLTGQIENWKAYVNPSWKIAAAQMLESESAAIESSTLKN
jgi:hypothetical protein